MSLTKLEREVITDSMLKIQSIQASLDQIEEAKIPDHDEIESCLENADKSFRVALRDGSPEKNRGDR
jgi:hypothetical protein